MKKDLLKISNHSVILSNNFAKTAVRLISNFALIALIFIFFSFSEKKDVQKKEEIKPGKKKATLILSDGRKVVLGEKSDTIVNGNNPNVFIKVDSCGINYFYKNKTKPDSNAKSKVLRKG